MLSIILSLNLLLAAVPAVAGLEIGLLFEVDQFGERVRVEERAVPDMDAEEFLIRGNHSVNRYLEIRAGRP